MSIKFDSIKSWLQSLGVDQHLNLVTLLIDFAIVLVIAFLAYQILKLIINRGVHRALKHAPERWYSALVTTGFFWRCANLAPVIVLYSAIPVVFTGDYKSWQEPASTVVAVYLTWVITSILTALTNVIECAYEYSSKAKEVPITGVVQVAKLIIVLTAIIISVAIIMNKSPLYLLSGIGAMTAIVMLVFRDTLMGFVAGVQLATNRMVAIGDWIEVPAHLVDGVVLEIGLITVKVENWDKTIVYLPTYALIHESFKNWQGMVNTGGRRIKRALMIDLDTSELVDDETLSEWTETYFQQNVDDWLAQNELQKPVSNLTVFRVYANQFLQQHPKIHKQMTTIARLLEPTPAGIPLELYGFSTDTNWTGYEAIQSSITETLYTSMRNFGLRHYQYLHKAASKSVKE